HVLHDLLGLGVGSEGGCGLDDRGLHRDRLQGVDLLMRGRIVALHLVLGGLLSEDEGDRDGVDGQAVGAEQRGEFGGGRIRSRIVCEADGVGRVHVREAGAQYLGGGRRAGPGGRLLNGGRGGG